MNAEHPFPDWRLVYEESCTTIDDLERNIGPIPADPLMRLESVKSAKWRYSARPSLAIRRQILHVMPHMRNIVLNDEPQREILSLKAPGMPQVFFLHMRDHMRQVKIEHPP